MKLNKLSIRDKEIFAGYLNLARRELSVYAFQNIYIWKGLFKIKWALIEDNLCVFFQDKIGCFLYLPALGEVFNPAVIKEVFRIMDSFNQNKEASRIENVEEKELKNFKDLGYASRKKYPDYLCLRKDLVQLKGNKFKSKRASFNYFAKHYKFKSGIYSPRQKNACLKLYDRWARERRFNSKDALYQGMLEDSRNCLNIILDDYKKLDLEGRVVEIEGKIQAFTFGYRLNQDTFCILYEVADLSIKGLAQFIFREFCRQLSNYKYINIMDDSGLENLKRAKLSYHPVRLISNYIVTRKNG